MKIVKQTPTLLVLKDNNWLLKLVGSAFFFLVGGFLLYIVLPFHIDCKIKQPNMAKQCHVYQTLFGHFSDTWMSSISKASLYSFVNSKGKRQYKVKLHSENKRYVLPMNPSFNKEPVQNAVTKINEYIKESSKLSFTLPLLYTLYLPLFLFIFPCVGLAAILWASNIKISFDKTKGRLEIQEKSYIRTSSEQYSLNEIASVELEKERGSKGTMTYRIVCIMDSGEVVPLNSVSDNRYYSKLKALRAMEQFGLKTNKQDFM